MKKILFLVYGLMSLVVLLLSCEDEFYYDDTKNFLPSYYKVKGFESSDTLEIVGIHDLVFDEIEKTDWKIISQSHTDFTGSDSLVLTKSLYEIEDEAPLLEIETNFGTIPVTLTNLEVTYEYMGQLLKLSLHPNSKMLLFVSVEKVYTFNQNGKFIQSGYIDYTLLVGYVPVTKHRQTYAVTNIAKENNQSL